MLGLKFSTPSARFFQRNHQQCWTNSWKNKAFSKEKLRCFVFFDFFGPWKNGLGWLPVGSFPANPDLVDILGDMDLDFENFQFWLFLDFEFLDFQVPRFPHFQKSGLVQSKELGQYREHPISASDVWGIRFLVFVQLNQWYNDCGVDPKQTKTWAL